MALNSIRLKAEALRSTAAASVTGSYTLIGTVYENPVRIYFLQNLTDAALLFSWDGTTDNIILPANGFLLIDCTTNKTLPEGMFVSSGTGTWVKTSGSPTTGAVYLSVFFGGD